MNRRAKREVRRDELLKKVRDVERLGYRLDGSIRTERITNNFEEAKMVVGFMRELSNDIEAMLETKHDGSADQEEGPAGAGEVAGV